MFLYTEKKQPPANTTTNEPKRFLELKLITLKFFLFFGQQIGKTNNRDAEQYNTEHRAIVATRSSLTVSGINNPPQDIRKKSIFFFVVEINKQTNKQTERERERSMTSNNALAMTRIGRFLLPPTLCSGSHQSTRYPEVFVPLSHTDYLLSLSLLCLFHHTENDPLCKKKQFEWDEEDTTWRVVKISLVNHSFNKQYLCYRPLRPGFPSLSEPFLLVIRVRDWSEVFSATDTHENEREREPFLRRHLLTPTLRCRVRVPPRAATMNAATAALIRLHLQPFKKRAYRLADSAQRIPYSQPLVSLRTNLTPLEALSMRRPEGGHAWTLCRLLFNFFSFSFFFFFFSFGLFHYYNSCCFTLIEFYCCIFWWERRKGEERQIWRAQFFFFCLFVDGSSSFSLFSFAEDIAIEYTAKELGRWEAVPLLCLLSHLSFPFRDW
eukprot:gene8028-5583_t